MDRSNSANAPSQYFSLFQHRRIKVEVFGTSDGRSAPAHVKSRLDEIRETFDVAAENGDELWLVLDRDHWLEPNHVNDTMNVLKEARQQGVSLALSNPCFDLWILLHFTEIDLSVPPKNAREVYDLFKKNSISYDRTSLNLERFN
jgi:RloB-like protein